MARHVNINIYFINLCNPTYIPDATRLSPGEDVLSRWVNCVAFSLLRNKTHQLRHRYIKALQLLHVKRQQKQTYSPFLPAGNMALRTQRTAPSSSSPRTLAAFERKHVSPAPLACCGRSGPAAPRTGERRSGCAAPTPSSASSGWF